MCYSQVSAHLYHFFQSSSSYCTTQHSLISLNLISQLLMEWTHEGSALFFPLGICQLFRKSPPHPAPWCSRGNYFGQFYLFIFAQIISYLSSHFYFSVNVDFFHIYIYSSLLGPGGPNPCSPSPRTV